MFAPLATATSDSFFSLCVSAYCLRPASASAPDGSSKLRVSWNTSLSAAQMASVSTVMISSTSSRVMRKVSLPTSLTAVPSANRPTSFSSTRLPAATERAIASESTLCTPMTLTSGRTAFT